MIVGTSSDDFTLERIKAAVRAKADPATAVKVLLEHEGAEAGTVEYEGVWAIPTDGGYRIRNIPVYAYDLALDDVISAEPDDHGVLRCTGLVKASRHSTIRLQFKQEADSSRVGKELQDLGCLWELGTSRLRIGVDVPPSVSFDEIRLYLERGERNGTFVYEEACLGFRDPTSH